MLSQIYLSQCSVKFTSVNAQSNLPQSMLSQIYLGRRHVRKSLFLTILGRQKKSLRNTVLKTSRLASSARLFHKNNRIPEDAPEHVAAVFYLRCFPHIDDVFCLLENV